MLVFAGPNRTADDAIVADVRFFLAQRGCAVLVATNDRQLRQRCTRAAVVLGGRVDARAKGGAKKAGRARTAWMRLVSSDSLLAAPRRCRRPFTRGRISAAVLPPVCEASEASEPSHQQYEVIRARVLEASATHCTTNLR